MITLSILLLSFSILLLVNFLIVDTEGFGLRGGLGFLFLALLALLL